MYADLAKALQNLPHMNMQVCIKIKLLLFTLLNVKSLRNYNIDKELGNIYLSATFNLDHKTLTCGGQYPYIHL